MISVLISKLVLLVFGTLYPAYASYKTVKTKNVRGYVQWMMYWIVYALYRFIEIFADIFVGFWFPFYYEFKILFVLWLMCPATRGSSYIFKCIINPHLSKNEEKIDSFIKSLWDHGYDIVRKIGAQGVDYLIEIVLNLLRKGQIQAVSFLPKINEIAQNASVINVPNPSTKNMDENIDDEEFDMLMVESSEFLSEDNAQTSAKNYSGSHNLRSRRRLENDSSDTDSEEASLKSQPIQTHSKNKKKASAQKQSKRIIK